MSEKEKVPRLTVDIIIEIHPRTVVLIERKNPPPGWALPGGFVDYGESLEEAAVREAEEETTLKVQLSEQFHTYSDPRRDSRHHNVSTVFIARAQGIPKGRDDARRAEEFSEGAFPHNLAFDHAQILEDYLIYKRTGTKPGIRAIPAS